MALKERLSSIRKGKGLSVLDLARAAGVSPAYLWQIESGAKRNPSGEVIKRLAAALGTTVADLMETSLAVPGHSLQEVPPSLRSLISKKARQLDIRQEDVEMLKQIQFRGRRPAKEEDYELIFLFLKRILG